MAVQCVKGRLVAGSAAADIDFTPPLPTTSPSPSPNTSTTTTLAAIVTFTSPTPPYVTIPAPSPPPPSTSSSTSVAKAAVAYSIPFTDVAAATAACALTCKGPGNCETGCPNSDSYLQQKPYCPLPSCPCKRCVQCPGACTIPSVGGICPCTPRRLMCCAPESQTGKSQTRKPDAM